MLNCGLIRAEWLGQKRLQSICYGSGVAISKRVVLTCAHSVFHDEKSLGCDVARFVPGHAEGKLKIQEKVYSSSDKNSIKLKALR
jgi:V8-like Glu-specific endopeptidase